MGNETLQIVLTWHACSPESVIESVFTAIAKSEISLSSISQRGEKATLLSVVRNQKASKTRAFRLSGQDIEIRFGSVAANELEFLHVTAPSGTNWSLWLEAFSSPDAIVMAWVVDSDYDYWQNATDPLEYEAAGRNYADLPLTSNGLPSPLEQTEIDTSQNAGRAILRDGYVEAVGSVMWLGSDFWQKTGARRSDVLAAHWLKAENDQLGLLKLQAEEKCFSESTGRSGMLQAALRALLFPRDCHEDEVSKLKSLSQSS